MQSALIFSLKTLVGSLITFELISAMSGAVCLDFHSVVMATIGEPGNVVYLMAGPNISLLIVTN